MYYHSHALTLCGHLFHWNRQRGRHVANIREDDETAEYAGQGVASRYHDGVSAWMRHANDVIKY